MLVEITVKSLKSAAAKLDELKAKDPALKLTAIDEGIVKAAAGNDGGKVTVPKVTSDRVNELLGVKPEAVSAETASEENAATSETNAAEAESNAVGGETSAAETELNIEPPTNLF